MISIKEKKDCCGCGACEAICNKNCISFVADADGFYYPVVDKESCVKCGACLKVCPIINVSHKADGLTNLFACSNNNDLVKKQSSSGGIFYLMASYILSKGGVIFGVKLSNDCRKALFTCAKSVNELFPILGSKYIQARTESIFQIVKNDLNSGVPVLFSGTPCQVAGLVGYLNKKYDNLYLIDLSCHGVPSEKVWNRYLDCREAEAGAKVISASFRSKESGWKDFSVSTNFSNGVHHAEIFTKDSYGKAFTQRLLFRPSCEHCKFKGLDRLSDVTLADFWGINEITDQFNDDQGVSLVITHSKKGTKFINYIKDSAKVISVSQEQGLRRNPYLFRSVVPHTNKKKFFEAIDKENFDELVERYAIEEFVLKDFVFDLKRYVKRRLKRSNKGEIP